MKNHSYINKEKGPFPFCPGCSHGIILDAVDKALTRFNPASTEVAVVTDIGCVGLSDQWFNTHAFHGLHGRSVLYGQGLKLAGPGLYVIVLMGDGGAGVGLSHLINAARRNINITVILFNNFNFGMTGGEHSVTSPLCSVTSTTPSGSISPPLKIAETLAINHAPFSARRSFSDKDLSEIIEKAILFNGFAFIEVLELCTAYYGSFNQFKKKDINHILESQSLPRMLEMNKSRPEFSAMCQKNLHLGETTKKNNPLIQVTSGNTLTNPLQISIAGSAGQKIQSTATFLAISAIMSGLYAIQRNDYPVTIKSGHSLSFLKISAEKTEYPGNGIPDFLFILSQNGYLKANSLIKKMHPDAPVFILSTLPDIKEHPDSIRIDLSKAKTTIAAKEIPLAVLAAWLKKTSLFELSLLKQAISENNDDKTAARMIKIVDSADIDIFLPPPARG